MKILVTYGTIGGNTYLVSEKILEVLKQEGHKESEMIDMEILEPEQLLDYDFVFMGASTWDEADYNEFARVFFDKFNESDVKLGKLKFALFGLGDKFYGHAYCASIPIMEKDLKAKGAKFISEPILIDGAPDDTIFADVEKWTKEVLQKL